MLAAQLVVRLPFIHNYSIFININKNYYITKYKSWLHTLLNLSWTSKVICWEMVQCVYYTMSRKKELICKNNYKALSVKKIKEPLIGALIGFKNHPSYFELERTIYTIQP
jgi:hypothetical protein